MKRWLGAWTPPIVANWLRAMRVAPAAPRAFTWGGVYSGFGEVPVVGQAYDERRLAQDSAETTIRTMQAIARGERSGEPVPLPRDAGLLALLATVVSSRRTPVRILDFGGAAGIDYVHLRALTRASSFDVDYIVVDRSVICELGREIHKDDSSIRFETAAANVSEPDIIHASGVLQYLDDWRGELGELLSLGSDYFHLANIFLGDFQTFATAQLNLPGTVAAAWVFSRDEVIRVFAEHGYRLILEVRTGLDYDQTNFPPDRRTGRARNLMFRRDNGNAPAA
jgi:putative methyltransferase (TIGR04325 family)